MRNIIAPKHILFVIESLSGGGAEKVLSVLLKYFDYEKYQVTVCPIVDTGVYAEEVKKYVRHYSPIITYKGNVINRLWNRVKYKLIYSVLPLKWVYCFFVPKHNDVEIAFCEGYVTKLLSHAKSDTKRVAWIHTDLVDNPWPIELGVFKDVNEERKAYSCFDKIVCVSHSVERSFHSRYGFENSTQTIYNPIDVDAVREVAKQCLYRATNIPRIVSAGRLVPQKGYDRLLKVSKQLHNEGFSFSLLILGEGQERQVLENYMLDNAMDDYVEMPGFSKNPYFEIASSDIFVCSSRAEGFSLVIAEAIILGLPVVSTYCSGPNELLENGKYGILVENSEKGLYEGLKAVLHGKKPRSVNIGEFANRFRVDVILKELYQILG